MKTKTMKAILAALLPVLFVMCAGCARTVTTSNPVIYSDVPDPDIIRVGNDYYMTSTTMHLLPGVPIMHSTDLVNWEIVSYVYDQLEDNDKASLLNGEFSYGGGSWASSIKYAGGEFHICFIANEQHKSYIYHTKDLTSGEWTRSDFDVVFHDPALFEDEDGSEWVVYGNGVLHITQLTDNFHAIKEGGIVDSVLLNLRSRELNLNAEGSHMYKRNGYYYIFDIDWPRGGVRREICNRSKDLFGPYEQKTVLYTTLNEGRGGFSANGVAQGGIVDTPTGEWYALLFQDHGPLGRCPVLVPMEWGDDDWPVMAGGDAAGLASGKTFGMNKLAEVGVMPEEVAVKTKVASVVPNWFCDDEFEYTQNKLGLAWQWNHNPDPAGWSVTERPGWLRIRPTSLAPHILRARNSPSQRLPGPRCDTEVLLDFSNLHSGDRAGICAFQSNYASVGIAVDENGTKTLSVMQRTGGGNKRMLGADDDGSVEVLSVPVPAGLSSVALKIKYIFDPADDNDTHRDFATLEYSFNGINWTDCGVELQMRYTLDIFMGYRTFLYCYSTLATGGYADFDYYHVSVK